MDYYELLKPAEPPRSSPDNASFVSQVASLMGRLNPVDKDTLQRALSERKSSDGALAFISSLMAYGFGIF